jgi:hypothetical protein
MFFLARNKLRHLDRSGEIYEQISPFRVASVEMTIYVVLIYYYSASSSAISLIESSESTIKRSLYSEPIVFLKALLLIWKR